MKKYRFTFAALALSAAASQAALVFQADMEMDGGFANGMETQSGWTSIVVAQAGNGTDTIALTDVGGSGVDLTMVANGNGIFNARGGSGVGRSVAITGAPGANEVIEDIISARDGDDTITVTLANLSVGQDYLLTGWHNGSGGNFGFVDNGSGGGITITPSLISGATLLASDTGVGSNITTVNSPSSISTLDPSSISFTATGTSVEIGLASDGTASFSPVGISGLELETLGAPIPEPSSSLLLLGALAGLGVRRRR